MKNVFFSDVKNFLSGEIGKLTIVVVIFSVALLSIQIYQIGQLTKIKKAIHYRYFNTVRTVEEIHQVKIDTRTGLLKEKVTRRTKGNR